MSESPTKTGGEDTDVANDGLTGREIEGPDGKMIKTAPNPRDAIMERVADLADEDRRRDTIAESAEEGVDHPDTGYKASTNESDEAAKKVAEAVVGTDGAASRESMHAAAPTKEALPADLQTDPLAEYIVMIDGKPMLRAKIDGEDQYVSLQDAQTRVQKDVAAEIRLQEASNWAKTLSEREKVVTEVEQKLLEKAEALGTSSPSAPTSDVDDQAADSFDAAAEAKGIVDGLLTGDTDEATAKLAAALQSARASGQTPIDINDLVQRAAAEARRGVAAEEEEKSVAADKKDLQEGYTLFRKDYPDIVSNKRLYDIADGFLPEIETEHPDWSWKQRFHEAGKLAKDWWSENVKTAEVVDPNAEAENSLNDRHERKENLVPMPIQRQGVQQHEKEEVQQTPSDALAEIKASRGQPA